MLSQTTRPCNIIICQETKKPRIRITKQKRDLTGKFALDIDSDYIPSDAVYSSEFENEAQLIKRSNSLLPVKLIWSKEAEMPKNVQYIWEILKVQNIGLQVLLQKQHNNLHK
jgi:hypothetical protein